jgi:hypothetical protein
LEQAKDVKEAIKFGNHKDAVRQDLLLQKPMKDDVTHSFALPLPIEKTSSIPRVLLALLNIQTQSTINNCGEIIPKSRLTHDQSRKWQSGTSVNSRVEAEKLMPCYFGQALKQVINWAVAACKCFLNREIFVTKLDIKRGLQEMPPPCFNGSQTYTQVTSLGLALMFLRLSLVGKCFPAEWIRRGARLRGSKSNAVNLILRLFLYYFVHTMSS